MRSIGGEASSSPNAGLIIAGVMGGLVFCALTLLLVYWWNTRRRRFRDRYPTSGYTTSSLPTWRERFEPTSSHQPDGESNRTTIGLYWNSQEWSTTPAPFYARERAINSLSPNPTSSTLPLVLHTEPFNDDSVNAEGQLRPRNREGMVQGERPPTYHTNTTGIATIATSLPQYSVHEPSPISERSEYLDTPTATTGSLPFSLLYGRDKPHRITGIPLTPI
jgi:hypothetical protein